MDHLFDEVKLWLDIDDDKKIDQAFNNLIAALEDRFHGVYSSPDDFLFLFRFFNLLVDLLIRNNDALSLSAYFMEWSSVFHDFKFKAPFTDEEKLPVILEFQKLQKKVTDYMEHKAEDEDEAKDEIEFYNSPNVRDPESKCLLCKRSLANKKGSHMVPNMLIEHIFNFQNKKGRDYEALHRFTLAEGEGYEYIGKNVLPEDIELIKNRPLR